MLDFIPDNFQSILIIVVLAVLFLAVMANNKRNQSKLRDRRKRNFKTDYFKLKNEREKESNS
ncbi:MULTISPECIES: hypothetical protein [Leeuwenhoekiella]|uniref:Uncharacterized protein n=1 Tax=Leeuwenhoekiella blandensis (strain CECT 7118 / CCUG 51940 / KCTC 22103 / MED217) TaxID=398720 RepID=A3XR39_LEEBM|nr:hypothetical protein [Leeuwenhoekiella blandensis]EAQ47985.1 hypothetical protein MED217_13876 [Leeuwenhoekiella blandensis MED217]